jgi:uncharacterized repeat protein (TIGR03803 family)
MNLGSGMGPRAEGTQRMVVQNFDFYTDGAYPTSNLTLDPRGDVYGVTLGGGANNQGTVFLYTMRGQFMTLHTFTSSAGLLPGDCCWTGGR